MDDNWSNSESAIKLGLLRAVDEKAELTQRSLANELGIALGLVNTYLKRCVSKGYIKTRQIPRNRYAYYLTPKGFAEKSKLAAEYLYQSLSLFRQAHVSYKDVLNTCVANGWKRICLCGCGDLADIAILLASEYDVEIVGIYDPDCEASVFHDHPVRREIADVMDADVWIVTSAINAQEVYDAVATKIPRTLIQTPALLEVHRAPLREIDP